MGEIRITLRITGNERKDMTKPKDADEFSRACGCSSRRCAVLFPSRDAVSPTDFDGCVLPNGHDGPHRFQGSDLVMYAWETDPDCDCEDCQSEEVDDWCIVYWPVVKLSIR